jgi:hypothetical protein
MGDDSCDDCRGGEFEGEGCVAGSIYGYCTFAGCYGLCEYEGRCGCKCHDEEVSERPDREVPTHSD